MPTPTELTPAEIAALECRIAGEAMEWIWKTGHAGSVVDAEGYWMDENGQWAGSRYWSPWRDPAAALKVLDRLVEIVHQGLGFIPRIVIWRDPATNRNGVRLTKSLYAEFPGDHFGPAACRLAQMVMENSK